MIYLINFTIINLFQDIFHFVYLNVIWTSVSKPSKENLFYYISSEHWSFIPKWVQSFYMIFMQKYISLQLLMIQLHFCIHYYDEKKVRSYYF